MTLVVGCHLENAAILLADSRATWQSQGAKNVYQDSLQKILPIAHQAIIAYAGQVDTAISLIGSLQLRIKKNKRLQNLGYLGPQLGRLARHDYATLQGMGKNPGHVAFVLAGVETRGARENLGSAIAEVRMWAYSAPRFRPTEVNNTFIAVGSGADLVSPFLQERWRDLSALAGVKEKTDWLIPHLESELGKGTDDYVGGLFQILMIEPDAIRPLNYWRWTLDPDGEDPISMSIADGTWTQTNLRSSTTVPVQKPMNLLRSPPKNLEVQSYSQPSRLIRHYPEAFLTYFVPCIEAKHGIGTAVFSGVLNCFSVEGFPCSIPLLGCFAIHPETGTHTISIRFGQHGTTMATVYQEEMVCTFPLEEIKRTPQVNLTVNQAGEYYLELWVDSYRLSRKPLVVRPVLPEIKAVNQPSRILLEEQHKAILETQAAAIDPELQSGECFVAYFVPCRRAEVVEAHVAFHEIGGTFYPPQFPAVTRYFLATGFRVKAGTYHVRVVLTETTKREVMPITTATVEATHDFHEIKLHGEITLPFPRQGVYVLDQYLEEKRIARAYFLADDINKPMAYLLREEEIQLIRNGESLMLARDSINVNNITPKPAPQEPHDNRSSSSDSNKRPE